MYHASAKRTHFHYRFSLKSVSYYRTFTPIITCNNSSLYSSLFFIPSSCSRAHVRDVTLELYCICIIILRIVAAKQTQLINEAKRKLQEKYLEVCYVKLWFTLNL